MSPPSLGLGQGGVGDGLGERLGDGLGDTDGEGRGDVLWLGDADGDTDGETEGERVGLTVSVGVGDGLVVERVVSVGDEGLGGGLVGRVDDDCCGVEVSVGTGSSRSTGVPRVGAGVVVAVTARGVLSNGGTATLTGAVSVGVDVGTGVLLGAVVGVELAGDGGPEGDATATFVCGPGMTAGCGPGTVRRMKAINSAKKARSASTVAARRDHGNTTG